MKMELGVDGGTSIGLGASFDVITPKGLFTEGQIDSTPLDRSTTRAADKVVSNGNDVALSSEVGLCSLFRSPSHVKAVPTSRQFCKQ